MSMYVVFVHFHLKSHTQNKLKKTYIITREGTKYYCSFREEIC